MPGFHFILDTFNILTSLRKDIGFDNFLPKAMNATLRF